MIPSTLRKDFTNLRRKVQGQRGDEGWYADRLRDNLRRVRLSLRCLEKY